MEKLKGRALIASTLSLCLFLGATAADATPGTFLTFVSVTYHLTYPTAVTNAGDGSGRLFIAEQHGTIRIWNGSQLLPTPFLDISSRVGPCLFPLPSGCGERGLLGIAF
ncbi:MAG TPA: glucose dehydrogenase, partial [Thermoanaerobaculia bacterium]|nr:glucose dehydrogenase [Thermoanaerobaculia bacterium]